MENCAGGELRGFIENSGGKKENVDVYLKYFSDIIEGLVEIHGRKQMHRDLKPENVFILIVGKTPIEHIMKLGDFGLLRDADKLLMSAITKGAGTSLYMSPEQHNNKSYGASSDVWAAGIILFEMLAGYHPFKTIEDLKMNPPQQLPAYVPEDIKKMIMNMLDKDPTKRMTTEEIKRLLYLRQSPSTSSKAETAINQEVADLKARNDQLQDSLSKIKSALETSKSET